jgi:acid stress chaperone HdeB
MKALAVACVAAGLLTSDLMVGAGAHAETIDLARIKCDELLATSKADIGYALAWLDAYYKNDDDPLIVDTDKFEADAKKLEEFCTANPGVGVMNASEKLFR